MHTKYTWQGHRRVDTKHADTLVSTGQQQQQQQQQHRQMQHSLFLTVTSLVVIENQRRQPAIVVERETDPTRAERPQPILELAQFCGRSTPPRGGW